MLKLAMISIGVYSIDKFLSEEECDSHIRFAEGAGFETASISRGGEAQVDRRVRNNDRVIREDTELASQLWSRAALCLPPRMAGRRLTGLNPRFRYYRYVPGQRFKWHADGSFTSDDGQQSILTFLIYLNDQFEGGQTRFRTTEVLPKQGSALIFDHDQSHEGAELLAGVKYVLRSDVMSVE